MEYEKAKYMYLAKVIKRGFYKNGNPFLPVEFFKYISGYQDGEDLIVFMQDKLGEYFAPTSNTYSTIISFMQEKGYTTPYQMTRDWLYSNPLLDYNSSVTKEKIDAIFDYIEMNGYPTINYVYNYFFRIYGTKELEIKKQNASEDNIIKLSLKKD